MAVLTIIGGVAVLGAVLTMGALYVDQARELSRTKRQLMAARRSIRALKAEQAELFSYTLSEVEAPNNNIKFGDF